MRVHASVAAEVRLVVRGSALILHLLTVRTSRLAAASLDHSAILAVALSGNLSFNILVVLVLSVLILSGSAVFRAFWLDHSI